MAIYDDILHKITFSSMELGALSSKISLKNSQPVNSEHQ